MKKFYALLPFLGLFLIACSDDDTPLPTTPDPDPIVITPGSADFTKYVAVGNSLTAGFSDNALFSSGQAASFPNMLASNFALAGGGDFSIPFMADDLGGATINGQTDANMDGSPDIGNRLILQFTADGPAPTPKEGVGTTEITTKLTGPFNNMGVPGAKSYELLAPGYGSLAGLAVGAANPYFVRFSSAEDASVIGDAAAQAPSFFSLWAGSNDILLYATSGGSGTNQLDPMVSPATYARNDITNPLVLAGALDGMLQALTAGGAKGVIANIPSVTDIPFFTTVPFAPLSPENPAFGPQIPVLNAQFAGLNLVFQALMVPERQFIFSESAASAVIIKDEDLPDLSAQITGALMMNGVDAATAGVTGLLYGQARQANEDDLLVLTSQTAIAQLNEEAFAMLQGLGLPPETAGQLAVNGVTFPLEDQWVLTPEEQTAVADALTAYNQTISALATQYDLAFVDANALLAELKATGFPLPDGSVVTSTFGTGGGFSLDGVHPAPRGYAILANAFLEAINEKYGSNFPGVNPLDFTGLYID
ncbi:G-D-S-L family lipolytic protein [Flagellimonas aquimarina]|uniref:G-D-S-L family lipolytic protein n=1 Tax=Flagellimonas aquimarina TaxID=2201895 RepID=A0A316KWI6_9FLAO|nr:G-D-S-L family lipolytic protein [Allomuricauda koreensis]PWL37921.1 G-D-S-L family lipolytic protein [Allomuricauda koreensis]